MIAHIRSSDQAVQTIEEHSKSVEKLAKTYGKKAGFTATSALAGFLHDMGKYSDAFCTYIQQIVLEEKHISEKIDHSTAGAKYLYESYYVEQPKTREEHISNLLIEIVGMVILSHHSGLQNFVQVDGRMSDYFRRVCKKDLPHYEEVKSNFLKNPENEAHVQQLYQDGIKEIMKFIQKVEEIVLKGQKNESVSLFVFLSIGMKYIFSCLIDADRTDARRFDENDTSNLHLSYQPYFKKCESLLEKQLRLWDEHQDTSSPINRLRAEMSNQCHHVASQPSSIYSLSIPTGGGKTLASLRYALRHAQKTSKKAHHLCSSLYNNY